MSHKRKRKAGQWLMGVGLLLLAAAGALTAYNIWDTQRAAEASDQVLEQLVSEIPKTVPSQEKPEPASSVSEESGEIEIPDHLLNPEMDMPVHRVDGNGYIGVLEIPELGLQLPVMSEWSDRNLKAAPCRYSGSAYGGDLVIAGHNYRSHFGDLAKLSLDSEILFTDVDGNVFRYAVIEFETLAATAVEEMTSFGPGLTLFTCTVSGKSRLTIRAEQLLSK